MLGDARLATTGVAVSRLAEAAPLTTLLTPTCASCGPGGRLRRRIDSDGLARMILQVVSMRTMIQPADPAERIIDDTFGMLMEGALVMGRPG